MTYYNTTRSQGEALREHSWAARKQDDQVLLIMKTKVWAYPEGMAPSDVHRCVVDEGNRRVPLTSIRRAMNTLTEKGFLEKTTTQREGLYGRPEYLWKLRGR